MASVIGYAKKNLEAARFILWGGVQSNNERALRLYHKFGFRTLGYFDYNGLNTDMIHDK